MGIMPSFFGFCKHPHEDCKIEFTCDVCPYNINNYSKEEQERINKKDNYNLLTDKKRKENNNGKST